MKLLITSVLLSTVFACSSNNSNSPAAPNTPTATAHQQLLQSATDYENANSVVKGFFGNLTPPSFNDPNLQKMIDDLKTCAYKSDGQGGGTLSGSACPITFTQTEALTATSLTTTETYKVVDSTFQTYSPVETFTMSANDTDLGGTNGGSITLTMSGTMTNEASFNMSESIAVSATQSNGEYTVTYLASVKSTTDNAALSAVLTAHNDAHGTPVVDTETCLVDNASVNCSAIGTVSKIMTEISTFGTRH